MQITHALSALSVGEDFIITVERETPTQPLPGEEVGVICEYQSTRALENPIWTDPAGIKIRTIEDGKF